MFFNNFHQKKPVYRSFLFIFSTGFLFFLDFHLKWLKFYCCSFQNCNILHTAGRHLFIIICRKKF